MNLTTPSTPWATPPSAICDFGWYETETFALFGGLIYVVDGNTYPPAGAKFQDYILGLNAEVTFDALDSFGLGIPKVFSPSGISIVDYSWDLGNGHSGHGPQITTIYRVQTPDAAATLTITDSLGRRTATTHRLNLVDLTLIYGSSRLIQPGAGRS